MMCSAPRLSMPLKVRISPRVMQNSCEFLECEVVHLYKGKRSSWASHASTNAVLKNMRREQETSDLLPSCPDNLVADSIGRQQGHSCNMKSMCEGRPI